MFKCIRCKTPLRTINVVGLHCEVCGCKIFFKDRPNVKKVIKAR